MAIDLRAHPRWMRTGYVYFPYAAQQSGQWWVLRLNHDFPAHDLYTLFVDGAATADITADTTDEAPLLAGIAALSPVHRLTQPELDPATAAAVVSTVAQYADYGSEWDDPCIYCEGNDGLRKEAPRCSK